MRLKMVQNQLVLLPGLDGTGELFAPFLNSPANRFTSTAVSYPRDKALHYPHLMPCIRGAMPWDSSYTLVAESFSGPLAIEFAAAQPESVRAIVLVTSFACNPTHPLLDWARFLIKDSWLEKPLPKQALKKFLLGEDCPEILVDTVMETIRSVRPEVLAQRIRMVLSADARGVLSNLDKPILYLLGKQDKLVGRRGLEAIMAVRPDVQVAEIDAPHLLLQRRPQEAIAAIEKFLDGLHFPRSRATAVPQATMECL